ncbi:MAG TPA: hypothetical protein PKA63_08595 [Oligoflexia bacterium]|nr:hypothetical protein [Oligoflexia bacterium]HMP48709.1 hypothetical protein [Oligoflexia bacterium]
MDNILDKVQAKVRKHKRLKNDPRVQSVLSFLVRKGFLISNERFNETRGVPSLSDLLFVAENFEPRVYNVIPAFIIHFRKSLEDLDALPAELLKITHAIEKGRELDVIYKGIHFREMKFSAEIKLNDKRVKVLGEKKVVKTFRLSPKVIAKLEEVALRESKNVTEVLEEMVLNSQQKFFV